MRTIALAVAASLFLTACSHKPVSYIPTSPVVNGSPGCAFLRYDLGLDAANMGHARQGNADKSRQDYSAAIEAALVGGSGNMLFLSGGSQHGAFGAGFLAGWKQRNGPAGLPRFSVVTGISTGGLQSTFAFLGRPEIATFGFSIDHETEILETYIHGADLDRGLPLKMVDALIRKGAISDLVPLRGRLDTMLTPEIMRAVSARFEEGAKLYVGATDFDSGQAVAFDLTEMAYRFATAPDDAHRRLYKTCYIEALIASSIVPVAAKPVFIDNRMYIDGGVRYAVFAEDIGAQLEKADIKKSLAGSSSGEAVRIYIILNGDGESEVKCGAREEDLCTGPNGTRQEGAAHEDWDFFTLASRSVSLLTNQVATLSIDRALNLARGTDSEVFFVRLEEEDLTSHSLNSGDLTERLQTASPDGTRTCKDWRQIDDNLDDPVEFHPRYMQCLISLGFERGEQFDWTKQPDQDAARSDRTILIPTSALGELNAYSGEVPAETLGNDNVE